MAEPAWKLRALDLERVSIRDRFWAPRLETNRKKTLPHQFQKLRETGRLAAYDLDWKPGQPRPPHHFWDSDVAKWLEAASAVLAVHRSPRLGRMVDEAIDRLLAIQQPDGYLNVHFTAVEPEKRWTNLRDAHELYCAGHFMEAAVAHHRATGERRFLDAMCRCADHIAARFGPGRRPGYPGHEEIELALVELYRATANPRYLRLAKAFLDRRGTRPHYFDREAKARGDDPARYWPGSYAYCQAHVPVREQDEAVGHSVRAMYLYSGMADVAAETGDQSLLDACRRLWASATERKMYLTGGVGSARHGERFTADYDLPNETAYAETCAAIGLVFFAHRMLHIEAHAAYADVMERALYNGVLAGVGLGGKSFFYVNPLASAGGHHRQPWFGCACCPPNLARLLASLGRYIYSASDRALYVHLYVAGQATAHVAGQEVGLAVETDYPWDGDVACTVGVQRSATFSLKLRIPGWCPGHAIAVNGKRVEARVVKGYATLRREWHDGDRVELCLDMPVQRVVAHPQVAAAAGRVALQRGPLVFCLEQCDHKAPVRAVMLPDKARLADRFARDLLGGAVVVEATAIAPAKAGWNRRLYRPLEETRTRSARLRAVPYCLWDNRAAGAMTVWMPRA
ncbi:MAG: glycoside hydrolase family 127 protein [Candidatus Brocadiia bacterium]